MGGLSWLLPSRCLGVGLLGGPQLLVLLAAEAFVIVAFALEELLEVRFAVELPLEGRKTAQAAGRQGRDRGEAEQDTGSGHRQREGGANLSLVLQYLQQKQLEWKTWLLATSRSIG